MRGQVPAKKQSAGLLLVRKAGADVQALLGHPGGPLWSKKDSGAWTIPKGLIAPGEPPLAAARREFAEETGHHPNGKLVSLGDAKQPGGKVVHVWAVQERLGRRSTVQQYIRDGMAAKVRAAANFS